MDSIRTLLRFLSAEDLLKSRPDERVFENTPEGPLRVLGRLGILDEQKAAKQLSEKLNIPFFSLGSPEVAGTLTTQEFVDKISPDICWKHKLVPLFEKNGRITLAVVNPFNMDAVKEAEFALGKRIETVIALENDIITLLNGFFSAPKVEFDSFEDLAPSKNVEILGTPTDDEQLDAHDVETPPIIKLCNKIIADAVTADASDIHVEPTQTGVEIRFRIDGIMHSIFEVPKRLQPYIITRFKILSGMDIAERRKPQDGRIRVRLHAEPIDLRVSSVPTSFGEKIVLRILKSKLENLSFEKLMVPESIESKLRRELSKRGKMMLVTGPTGSGKTTTLYSCLNIIRDGTTNIETVEDPIEYRIPGIQQIQVNASAGVSFASALRSVLRQDPDVIMIGEIRDQETAEIALQAAQTGHLVLSTLHTNTAPSAISRMLTLGVDPFVMASCLSSITAQRLVRKICADCCTPASDKYLARHEDIITDFELDPAKLFEPVGCAACNSTGYKGRVALYSFFEITDEMADLILVNSPASKLIEKAKERGFRTLTEAAFDRLYESLTTLEEIRPYYLAHDSAGEQRVKPIETDVKAEPENTVIVQNIEKEKKPKGTIEKQKVVLIEDDEDVRKILALLLEKEMFEVVEAENGQEGLQAVYDHQPTLVLCDLMMPIMDGKEFLVKMKNNSQTNEIPIVILTAADTETNETGLLDLGAADFVSKASSSAVMLSRLRRVLQDA